jgi:hypothetical protein
MVLPAFLLVSFRIYSSDIGKGFTDFRHLLLFFRTQPLLPRKEGLGFQRREGYEAFSELEHKTL